MSNGYFWPHPIGNNKCFDTALKYAVDLCSLGTDDSSATVPKN